MFTFVFWHTTNARCCKIVVTCLNALQTTQTLITSLFENKTRKQNKKTKPRLVFWQECGSKKKEQNQNMNRLSSTWQSTQRLRTFLSAKSHKSSLEVSFLRSRFIHLSCSLMVNSKYGPHRFTFASLHVSRFPTKLKKGRRKKEAEAAKLGGSCCFVFVFFSPPSPLFFSPSRIFWENSRSVDSTRSKSFGGFVLCVLVFGVLCCKKRLFFCFCCCFGYYRKIKSNNKNNQKEKVAWDLQRKVKSLNCGPLQKQDCVLKSRWYTQHYVGKDGQMFCCDNVSVRWLLVLSWLCILLLDVLFSIFSDFLSAFSRIFSQRRLSSCKTFRWTSTTLPENSSNHKSSEKILHRWFRLSEGMMVSLWVCAPNWRPISLPFCRKRKWGTEMDWSCRNGTVCFANKQCQISTALPKSNKPFICGAGKWKYTSFWWHVAARFKPLPIDKQETFFCWDRCNQRRTNKSCQ